MIKRAKKLDETCRRIREEIERGGLWGQRIAGYRRLAVSLGVSGQTVQRALDILEAEGVVERRHGSGTYALTPQQKAERSRVNTVGVIANTQALSVPSQAAIADIKKGIASRAHPVNIDLKIYEWGNQKDRDTLEDTRQIRGLDGFIFIRFMRHDLVHRLMRLCGKPIIAVDQSCQGLPVITVNDETFPGSLAVTRHLISLGHRRVAFLDIDDRTGWNSCKYAGYRSAMHEQGLAVDDGLVAAPPVSVISSQEVLERAVDRSVEKVLGLPDPATAFFAYDDRRALAAMKSLRQRGLEPGRDIAVAGFGDTAIRAGLCADLTSCRIPFQKMGEEAMLAMIDRPFEPGRQGAVFVRDRLMKRASTLGARQG